MAQDMAKLGFSIDTSDLKKAAADMKKVGAEGKTTGRMASQLAKDMTVASRSTGQSARQIATDMGKTSAAAKDVARASRSFDMRGISMQLSQVAQQASATGRPLQALAIQLPDLAMYLGGPLAIGIGAAAGALLSMAANMGEGSSEAGRFKNSLEALAVAVGDYERKSEAAAMSTRDLYQKYGEAANSMRTTLQVIQEISGENARREIDSVAQSLTELYRTAADGDARQELADFFGVNINFAIGSAAIEARNAARVLTSEFQQQQSVLANSNGQIDRQIGATTEIIALARQLAEVTGGVSKEEAGLIANLSEALELMTRQKAALVATEQAQERLSISSDKTAAALSQYVKTRLMGEREALRTASELIGKYSQQATLYEAIVAHGASSTQVAELRHQAETANLREMVEQLGVSRSVKEEIYAAADAAFAASQEAAGMAGNLGNAAAQAAALAANLGAAAVGAERQAEVGLARVNAQLAALRSGQDEVAAGARAALGVERERYAAAQRAAGLTASEAELAAKANFANREALIDLQGELTSVRKSHQEAAKAARRSARAGASAARKALRDLRKDAERWIERVSTPLEKYKRELAELNGVMKAGLLSQEMYGRAVGQMNDELGRSVPLVNDVADAFGDWVSRGFRDFKGFANSVFGMFRSLIAKMVATAARNRIMIGLGLTAGAGGGALGAANGGGFGGGIISKAIGGVLGSWGGGTGILGGLGTVFGGLKAGGIAGAIGGIGTAFAAGPLAAIGAALPIVGLGIALFSAFRTKTKELDAGIDVHLQGLNATAQKWQKLQKSTLFGLVKWKSNKTSAADAAFTSPIQQAYREMQESTRVVAKLAGAHAGVLDNFAASFNLSTKGKSADQVQQEIQKWVAGINNQLARTILAQGNGFDLTHLIRQGEGASVTLKALAASMQVMRTTFGELGLSMRGFSNDLLGANLARNLLDQNGGAEAFTAAADVYLQNFYSPMERAGKLADKMRASLGQVGIRELPTTMGRLRELTEYFAGIGYAEQAARLVSLAPMFTEWKRLSDEMAEGANAAAEQSRKAAEDAAKAAKKAADDAAAEIRRIRGDYSLDGGKYRTEAEAKLAFELENRGKHSGEKLDAQNALLREIRDLLNRQASTADFALARS